MEALICVTYRCNAKCHMCNIWKYPTTRKQEITPADLKKIPSGLEFANITGGEPFLREDIEELIKVVLPKTKRLVISTNGYFTEKIVALAKKYPQIGVRVSIEGLPKANDELRGLKDGFDHGIRTLIDLHELGLKDIGFGITVSDRNAKDLLELYHLAKWLGLEFATAAIHNTYYFHKDDNQFKDRKMITDEFKKLIDELLASKKPKDWFRAYFNYGLINFINGNKRLLPCEMGTDVFFIDPFGEVYPCNGMNWSMGNIKKQKFEEIWNGEKAKTVREKVKNCSKNCWMVGSASPAIKKDKKTAIKWILKSKLKGKVEYGCVENKR
ncbi:radical SAM protein [Candidatus Woesearchaeota archaeon]|nr:radical SAM protein [Candidatus Woesearchaeota archaeon]